MKKKEEFPGAQVARPGAEQWEMAEELHMMQRPPLQCHDSEECCTNSLTSSDHFTLQCMATTTKLFTKRICAKKKLNHTFFNFFFYRMWYQSLLSRVQWMTEVETCLPGHSTSETDSQGYRKELRCSVWSPRGPSVPSERS